MYTSPHRLFPAAVRRGQRDDFPTWHPVRTSRLFRYPAAQLIGLHGKPSPA